METHGSQIPSTIGGDNATTESADSSAARESRSRQFDTEADQIAYLESKDTNYVFLFGGPACGKTAITSSIIYHLSNPEDTMGDMEEFRYDDDARNRMTALNLLARIRSAIDERRFPDRTVVGSLTHVNVRYVPKSRSRPAIPITFLEMSGEDLNLVEAGLDSIGRFPSDIEVFFKTNRKKVRMVFILVTSVSEAASRDVEMVKFLDYITAKDPRYRDSKILLLVSQWDTYQGGKSVRDFVEQTMKLTWNRIGRVQNGFGYFSLGRIDYASSADGKPKPFIIEYDEGPARRTFNWLYFAITGIQLVPWWKRLFGSDE